MIFVLIPTYNEYENLESLASNLFNKLNSLDVFYVFSDDGSTDGSPEKIKKLFQNKQFIVLGDGSNNGPGYAFNSGFEWILNNSKNVDDIVITMEADNTSDINLLDDMLSIQKLGYDLVLASVYAQGGGFEKTNFFRKFISFFANMLFRTFFNVKILTLSSFYRVYSLGLLKRIQSRYGTLIKEKGFICMLEILLKSIHTGCKIIEVPMTLKSTQRVGKSKMKIFKTTLAYLGFLIRFKGSSY
ncbi:MAG: glycosyltransferase [Flavobacteriales bacterium]|nr:glycosyltransferase [Flavobacteriales bacterium]